MDASMNDNKIYILLCCGIFVLGLIIVIAPLCCSQYFTTNQLCDANKRVVHGFLDDRTFDNWSIKRRDLREAVQRIERKFDSLEKAVRELKDK